MGKEKEAEVGSKAASLRSLGEQLNASILRDIDELISISINVAHHSESPVNRLDSPETMHDDDLKKLRGSFNKVYSALKEKWGRTMEQMLTYLKNTPDNAVPFSQRPDLASKLLDLTYVIADCGVAVPEDLIPTLKRAANTGKNSGREMC